MTQIINYFPLAVSHPPFSLLSNDRWSTRDLFFRDSIQWLKIRRLLRNIISDFSSFNDRKRINTFQTKKKKRDNSQTLEEFHFNAFFFNCGYSYKRKRNKDVLDKK